MLAAVLGLSGADVATVGASATELRHALGISDTQVGLLVASTLLVGAVATLPFGVLADHVRRTTTLAGAIALWGAAMGWCAAASDYRMLLVARLFLGIVTAAAGPLVASLVGDYFDGRERGRVWGLILMGELVGVGFGFLVTGDIALVSWRAAFVALAVPAFALTWFVWRLPEPDRGTSGAAMGTDRMSLPAAARVVLRVRTNALLIVASTSRPHHRPGDRGCGIGRAGRGAVHPRDPGHRRGRRPALPGGRGLHAGGAEPPARRGPARRHAGAPLGRAEAVRTVVRSLAQALAPVLFGAISDDVFGGGRAGLKWTFLVMLAPLAGSAVILWRARRTWSGSGGWRRGTTPG